MNEKRSSWPNLCTIVQRRLVPSRAGEIGQENYTTSVGMKRLKRLGDLEKNGQSWSRIEYEKGSGRREWQEGYGMMGDNRRGGERNIGKTVDDMLIALQESGIIARKARCVWQDGCEF